MSSFSSPASNARYARLALVSGLAFAFSPELFAQSDNLEASVAGGLRFEDNLLVDSLDVSSPESDFAAVGNLDLTYRDKVRKNIDLRFGYALEGRRYFQEDDFDLQLHYGYLDLSRDLSGITAGAIVDATYARIGGEALLNKQKLSGYLSDLVTRDLYIRGSLGLENTDFSGQQGRDNKGQRLDASGYYFLNGTNRYLTVSARYNQRQASDSVFDYNARRISFGYVERMTLADDWPIRVRADWRYEKRRYDETDPALGVRREDDRTRWRLRMDAPVSDSVTVELKYEHRNYSSDNPALDFDDNRIEVMLEVALL
ncbi:surface lipoprotein assembly modifier [Marinobacter confluentis]|uniref:DUF560 domain-containing protein n=1 Tax=Marinobacter confluentis TaxID=1697557 RepID=A0A4Z1BT77_9GAMM|nr:surface lipoprotein assembly modifier [Marinobacter confluentis]TGN40409.1 DUF560 domain-containing protein [Marinobacter confluentis]